jgi:hypothetical protein
MEPQEIIATAESVHFRELNIWTLRRGLVFREVA